MGLTKIIATLKGIDKRINDFLVRDLIKDVVKETNKFFAKDAERNLNIVVRELKLAKKSKSEIYNDPTAWGNLTDEYRKRKDYAEKKGIDVEPYNQRLKDAGIEIL